MNECFPKKKLPNRKNLPWLSKKLINLINQRNLLYKRAKLTGSFSKYKAMWNRVASELQFAKQFYFQRLNPKNSKDFWRVMKYLNRQKSTIPALVDDNDTEATSNSEKADMLYSFFCRCFNPSGRLKENVGCPTASPGESLGTEDLELYCEVKQVEKWLLQLDTSKSNGPDGISWKMLKYTAACIAPSVTKLLNLLIQLSVSFLTLGKLLSLCLSQNQLTTTFEKITDQFLFCVS